MVDVFSKAVLADREFLDRLSRSIESTMRQIEASQRLILESRELMRQAERRLSRTQVETGG